MYFDHRPLHSEFGVEIGGADLMQSLSDAQFAEIREAFETHSLLLFKGPALDDDRQFAFSARFGAVQVSFSGNQSGGTYFSRQSNIDTQTGALLAPDHKTMVYQRGNAMWHSDSSYRAAGSLCSVLSAREVPPEGGNTDFVSMRVAWDALPDDLKQEAEERFAVHSIVHSRNLITPDILTDAQKKEIPAARHPIVKTNPANGRKSLFIGVHASHVEGLPVEEGRAFLAELLDRASGETHIHSHAWEAGDVLVWDNRCMLHRAAPYDATRYRRLMQRTTIAGEATLQ